MKNLKFTAYLCLFLFLMVCFFPTPTNTGILGVAFTVLIVMLAVNRKEFMEKPKKEKLNIEQIPQYRDYVDVCHDAGVHPVDEKTFNKINNIPDHNDFIPSDLDHVLGIKKDSSS